MIKPWRLMISGIITFASTLMEIRQRKTAVPLQHTYVRRTPVQTWMNSEGQRKTVSFAVVSSLEKSSPRKKSTPAARSSKGVFCSSHIRVTSPVDSSSFSIVCLALFLPSLSPILAFVLLQCLPAHLSIGWSNAPGFPPLKPIEPGFDPISGQAGAGGSRSIVGTNPKAQAQPLKLPVEWVLSRGGEYFFSPSIPALKNKFALKDSTAQPPDLGKLSLSSKPKTDSASGPSRGSQAHTTPASQQQRKR